MKILLDASHKELWPCRSSLQGIVSDVCVIPGVTVQFVVSCAVVFNIASYFGRVFGFLALCVLYIIMI